MTSLQQPGDWIESRLLPTSKITQTRTLISSSGLTPLIQANMKSTTLAVLGCNLFADHRGLADEEIHEDGKEQGHQPRPLNLASKGETQKETEVERNTIPQCGQEVGHILEAVVNQLLPLVLLFVHRL